ncbi:hypothetical protein BH10ACI1_BH10ACI1_02820 [soil metagenome]
MKRKTHGHFWQVYKTMILTEILNLKVILGAMPESGGLLIFGIGLIIFTVLLRGLLNWAETLKEKSNNKLILERK